MSPFDSSFFCDTYDMVVDDVHETYRKVGGDEPGCCTLLARFNMQISPNRQIVYSYMHSKRHVVDVIHSL